jgi:hypothetical protein
MEHAHVRLREVVQAERRKFGAAYSSSSSSSLDSSIPTIAAASPARAVGETTSHAHAHAHAPLQAPPIIPPSETHAAQHVASTGQTPPQHMLPQRPPSADPESRMRGSSSAARTHSPSAAAHTQLTRSSSMTAAHACTSPLRRTPSPNTAAHAAARSEALRSDVEADFSQQRSPGQHAFGSRRAARSPDHDKTLPRDRSLSFRTSGGLRAQNDGLQGANDEEDDEMEFFQGGVVLEDDRGTSHARLRSPHASKRPGEPSLTSSASTCFLPTLYCKPKARFHAFDALGSVPG